MTDANHLLPSAVIRSWDAVTADALSAVETETIMTVVRAYLPPCTEQALKQCLVHYHADFPDDEGPNHKQVNELCQRLDLEAGNLGRYATQYPLHAAVTQRFGRTDHDGHRAARLVLVGLFSAARGGNADLYYSQLLQVRRCLIRALGQVQGDHENWRSAAEAFLHALTKPAGGLSQSGPNAKADLQMLRDIVSGNRAVAVNKKVQPTGVKRPRPPRQSPDSELRERLVRHQSPPSAAAREEALAREESRVNDAQAVIGGATYQVVSSQKRASNDEPADDTAPTWLRRTQPSALTPSDDRAMMRQAPRMAATSALVAKTDPQRLPLGRALEALAFLGDDDLQWAFAWLMLTTGMPSARLAGLRASSHAPVDGKPHWHNNTLTYRLADGPVAAGPAGTNQLVSLTLPRAVQDALTGDSKCEPFAGVAKTIDNRLAHAFRHAPGITPTLLRLRATAELQILGHAQDTVAARALGGHYSLAYAAPAAYRQFAPGELQALFEASTSALTNALGAHGEPSPALARRIALMQFPESAPESTTGSARALIPGEVHALFSGLHAAGTRSGAHLLQMANGESGWTGVLQQVVHAQAAMTYLLWALSTGARPIATKTVFVVADPGVHAAHQAAAYLSDKASGAYRERRLVPVIDALAKQLDLHREACRITQTLLERRGWCVHEARHPDQKALPARLVTNRDQTAEWQVFRQADYKTALTQAGLDTEAAVAANATRHTVATRLREVLPDAQVDALLGHARLGLGVFAPASTTTPDWRGLREALEGVLRDSQLKPATIEALYHAR